MFIFGFKGYNNSRNPNNNENGNRVIFLDYVLFIANIFITIGLLICLVIKCHDIFIKNIDGFKELLYLELIQLAIYFLTLVFSIVYCIRKSKKIITVSRLLFLSNILFNLIILFAFDLISEWNFRTYYYQIINNIINLVVIIFILIDCIIYHIKTTRDNARKFK